MTQAIEKAIALKQKLVDFVYDAEGELAVALETYAAEQSKKSNYGIKQQNLTIDTFITEGKVGTQTPLTMFLAQTDLSESDRNLLQNWQKNFTGLFEIQQIQANCFDLMNWLTAKKYCVYTHSQLPTKEMNRWQPGEIILTRIAPINEQEWFFFSDFITKGRLSKPKLAVAIGEFKSNYPDFLYGDAPELLEQAWDSVAEYHQEFVDFFKSDRITLPGRELNQKISELQQQMSKKRLAAAGIDDSQSFQSIMASTGANEAEITEAATELGADAETVAKVLKSKEKLSMVTPKVELPPEIKQAGQVTVFSHPRWGQMFLPSYTKFVELLQSENFQEQPNFQLIVRKYLEEPQINFYIWQQLKEEFPTQLENLLQIFLQRPNFKLETDLETTLLEYDKSSKPQLPEIASVPLHLQTLFEEAVAQVQKSKYKTKKKKNARGFK
ncbi:hypothetical protein STA3757_15710 [Stanieria sp. NIES-3757]|nr:hypothetical protein STA3757_15710 [Stanieria sp. NIES-3757]